MFYNHPEIAKTFAWFQTDEINMLFCRKIVQFIAVAREGSFTQAADKVSLTPSAISHAVSELEHCLGRKLVIRKNSGTTLTRVGRKFYNDITPIYEEASAIFRRIRQENNKIIICSDGSFYPSLQFEICYLIEKFGNEVELGYGKDLLEEVKGGNVDIAFCTSTNIDLPFTKGILRFSLPLEKMGIIVHKNTYNKYSSVMKMISEEYFFQQTYSLEHPVFFEIKKLIEQHSIKAKFIGLPDAADVYSTISQLGGISLVTQDFLQSSIINSADFYFLSQPFPFELEIHRGIYIKDSRLDDLSEVIFFLQNKWSKNNNRL